MPSDHYDGGAVQKHAPAKPHRLSQASKISIYGFSGDPSEVKVIFNFKIVKNFTIFKKTDKQRTLTNSHKKQNHKSLFKWKRKNSPRSLAGRLLKIKTSKPPVTGVPCCWRTSGFWKNWRTLTVKSFPK